MIQVNLREFSDLWLPRIDDYMQERVSGENEAFQGMYSMIRYHMGWEDQEGSPQPAPQGKRVRPLLVLLACRAAGAEPSLALPAAAAVELLHNFSLIHDDIEDRGTMRRHRPALWTWAGEPQAINAGDALFTIARQSLTKLGNQGVAAEQVIKAMILFDQTCLRLTEGQYLDMRFEEMQVVTPERYLEMIGGKTAALIATSAQLGAIVANSRSQPHFWQFGYELGLSFQIQDDILGIWGDKALTGKSTASDLLTRKKTFPVLYAMAGRDELSGRLRELYNGTQAISEGDLIELLNLLNDIGAREHAVQAAEMHADAALRALSSIDGDMVGLALLKELALGLLGRQT